MNKKNNILKKMGECMKYNTSLVMKLKKNEPPKTEYIYHIPKEKGKYPVYDIPATGKSNWMEGAYTLCFVYSKYNGNFVIRGYRREVMDFLKKNFTHYFCYISMWCNGQSRGYWRFWKENTINIFQPSPRSKHFRSYKHIIEKYDGNKFKSGYNTIKKLEFKRMPHRWIPEFDKL
jgi:hypothetical protein